MPIFLHKRTPLTVSQGGLNNELAMSYSHMANATLPLAQIGFTSEFGKGSGGSQVLWSPAQLVDAFMVLSGCHVYIMSGCA